MRTPLVTLFDEALNKCFSSAMEDILGSPARDAIYQVLEKEGIAQIDVSSRFDDIVRVLTKAFGECSRVIVHKTVVGLFQEYSQRVDFAYQDSLKDRLIFLRARVVDDHLVPRRAREEDFFDKNNNETNNDGTEADKGIGWSGFYRLKWGVGQERQ